jgi:hypothetical protein
MPKSKEVFGMQVTMNQQANCSISVAGICELGKPVNHMMLSWFGINFN